MSLRYPAQNTRCQSGSTALRRVPLPISAAWAQA